MDSGDVKIVEVDEDETFEHAGDDGSTGDFEHHIEPEVDLLGLDRVDDLSEDLLSALTCAQFLARGGGWGGSYNPCMRAWATGRRNGLRLTSTKRSWGSAGSDHHTSQLRSFAVDMSNGSAPTPQMDLTARQIAAALGRPGWTRGILEVTCVGVRAQLIWRYPGHYDHVHFGCRVG